MTPSRMHNLPRVASPGQGLVGSIRGGATRIVASTTGAILSVSGIEHGVGEAIRGSVTSLALVLPADYRNALTEAQASGATPPRCIQVNRL